MHCCQSRDIGRTHYPLLVSDLVHLLPHFDHLVVHFRQIWSQVSDELSNSQAIPDRNGVLLAWEESPHKPSVHGEWATFYFPTQWVGSIENQQLFVQLSKDFKGVGQSPHEGVIPSSHILDIIDQDIHALKLTGQRGFSGAIQ